MACLIVPAVQAIATTVASKVIQSKEKDAKTLKIATEYGDFATVKKVPFSKK
ncbi:MAG: hypothetical protein GXZ13_05380 [Synergistaceae bacterium]|nr:hypothetical protein [Synergistaceae bacterium]